MERREPRRAEVGCGRKANEVDLRASLGVPPLLLLRAFGQGLLIVGAIVSAVANGSPAARGERPHSAWLATGYILGTGNLIVGGLQVATSEETVLRAIGVAHLTVGATSMGMTIWGHTQPSPEALPPSGSGAGLSLGAFVSSTRAGSHGWGLALRLWH